jgi:AcrR family transcriptional regulator
MQGTRSRILTAAEGLFADRGFSATSVRMITSRAQVNVAAMHYHFGSKDRLIQELFALRLSPLNRQRLALLGRCHLDAEGGVPSLEKILEAFVRPPVQLISDPERGGMRFMQLLSRAFNSPDGAVREMIYVQFAEVIERFSGALGPRLPHLSREEAFWRFHFMVGAMSHTLHVIADWKNLESLFLDVPEPSRVDEVVDRLVRFLAAGFRTPIPSQEDSG